MTTVLSLGRRAAAVLLLGALAGIAAGSGAWADDTTVAWSVSPADAGGTVDGRTRLSMELAPGASVTEHVVVANSSTTEQVFHVYGADALNTVDGGYDLQPAATAPVDGGAWVVVETPQVTIPALGSQLVAFTVTAPADATPGDHAAGIVVSRAQPATDASGVLVDTRVAVRLGIRVPGELTPQLDVRQVQVSYSPSLVPFGGGAATVRYEVVNRGNVTVVGEPRLRITGPLGVELASLEPEDTNEVLPGQSFTVTSTVVGVAPALLDTAVVDVAMAAAPGPDTQIPLVSTSARASFAAVPWTGLAVLALVAVAVWWALRTRRVRREEGEELWRATVAAAAGPAGAGVLPSGSGAPPRLQALLVVAVLGVAFGMPAAAASWLPAAGTAPQPSASSTTGLALTLSVPRATGGTTTPTATPTGTTVSAPPAATSGGSTTTSASGLQTRTTVLGGPGTGPSSDDEPVSQVLADEGGDAPTEAPAPSAAAAADTTWNDPAGTSPMGWALLAVSGAATLGAAGWGIVRWRARGLALPVPGADE